MKKSLDAKIKMCSATEDNYLTHKSRYDVVEAMEENMDLFIANNAQIRLLVPLAEETTKPTTADKDIVLDNMCESAVLVSKAIQSYADSIGDVVLEGTMNWTIVKLKRLRLDQVGPICEGIHTKGTELLTVATPFGLTQAKLDLLDDNNVAWEAKEAATRNKLVDIGLAKEQISKRVADNMKRLTKRLDRMVYTLTESDPEAVRLWDENRKIINLPVTNTQAKIMVKEQADGIAVPEAEVLLVNGTTLRAITDENGEAVYKLKKNGLFALKVTASGFKPFEKPQVRMYLGKINRFEVELEPDMG